VGASAVGPGDDVADRRLVRLLGAGGEGEVWQAVRPDGTACALKLVRPEVLPEPEEVRRRGRWLVRIDHPSMVRVTRGGRFTAGELAGWGFVEMDLVDGPSLQQAPALPDALQRLAGVAQALDLLHAGAWSDGVPLVHRDVKPGNLLAGARGLVLVDPSTMRGLDTRDLSRVGTPAYVAPEVVTGRFGPLADVYSLAATAAALLTGARGHDLGEVVDDPWAHGLPDGVCAALDPDPSRRPATCAAVVSGRPLVRVAGVPSPPPDGTPDRGPIPGGPAWSVWALAVVSVAPATAWALRLSRPSLVPAEALLATAGAAAVLHLAVHLGTGRPAAGVLAPPWAWGDLVAGRRPWPETPDRRTGWLADVVAGTLVLGTAAVVAAAVLGAPPVLLPAAAATAVALVVLWRRLAQVTSRVAWAPVWTLTLPLRLLAAVPRLLASGSR
jgi:eukaryotic-like serine/threonine-protein kinase